MARQRLPGDPSLRSALTSVVLNPAEPCPMTERPVMPLLRRLSAIQTAMPFFDTEGIREGKEGANRS